MQAKTILALFLSWLGVAVLAGTLVLATGAIRVSQTVRGPFAGEAAPSVLLMAPVGGPNESLFFDDHGNIVGHPSKSDLRVAINGRAWPPAETQHVVIRAGQPMTYSHWQRHVYFSLPPEISNSANTTLTMSYRLVPRPLALAALVALSFILLLVGVLVNRSGHAAQELTPWGLARVAISSLNTNAGGLAVPHGANALVTLGYLLTAQSSALRTAIHSALASRAGPILRIGISTTSLGAKTLSLLALALAASYLVLVILGVAQGSFLPTAAPLDGGGVLTSLSSLLPFLHLLILSLAALGALSDWIASSGSRTRRIALRNNLRLMQFWEKAGPFFSVVLLVLMLSAGGWTGRLDLLEMNYMSLFGLVPYSDGGAYATAPFDLATSGTWGEVASRRAFAGAFRQSTFSIADYSYAGALIFQACLLGIAIFWSSRAVAQWRGFWSGLAFFALLIGLVRPFLSTAMTEPLGTFWALLSIPFFVEALRRGSSSHAVLGVAIFGIAMLTRAGALFLLPLLVVWASFFFGSSLRDKARLCATIIGIFAIEFACESLLRFLYGTPDTSSKLSLAYIVCGLARGTDWFECYHTFQADIERLGNNDQSASFLLDRARDAFLEHPQRLYSLMLNNVANLFSRTPQFFLGTYMSVLQVSALTGALCAAALIPGLVYRKSSWAERGFLVALLVGIASSAAWMLQNDGWRALYVSHVLMALVFSAGFTTPISPKASRSIAPIVSPRTGVVVIGIALSVAFIVPSIAHQAMAHTALEGYAKKEDGDYLPGRTQITGVIVRTETPTNSITGTIGRRDFRQLVSRLNLENEWGKIRDEDLPVSDFAFFSSPRINKPHSMRLYIGPTELLTRRGVSVWRTEVRPIGDPTKTYLWRITKATAIADIPSR